MKELWTVLVEKLKQLEAEAATIVLVVLGLFTIGMSTIVIVKFINMIIKLAELFGSTGHSAH
jgi:hypothetical protein